MSKTSISIMGLEEIAELLSKEKTRHDIVSIRSTDIPDDEYRIFEDFKAHYRDIIVEVFDDIESPWEDRKVVTLEQIDRILKWAKGRKSIVVHCTAGISRSSAIAYLIACTRTSPAEALKILSKSIHSPNGLVVHYGAQLLGDDSVYAEYSLWLD